MDFYTMRENCIAIHQVCHEIGLVTNILHLPQLTIHKDELATNEKTKSWYGMGRYAKELYDDAAMWAQLPSFQNIISNGQSRSWSKESARLELLICYEKLGGMELYTYGK